MEVSKFRNLHFFVELEAQCEYNDNIEKESIRMKIKLFLYSDTQRESFAEKFLTC